MIEGIAEGKRGWVRPEMQWSENIIQREKMVIHGRQRQSTRHAIKVNIDIIVWSVKLTSEIIILPMLVQ